MVDEICSMLDGLPLGLELAAARVSLLPLSAIRDRLAARLPLPGTGPRDVPTRQRTLESTIAWSHDLLGEAEQRLLHDLAVFEGSFDVEQAAAVAGGDVLDGLATLAEHSLVAPLGATARWRHPVPDAPDNPIVRARSPDRRGTRARGSSAPRGSLPGAGHNRCSAPARRRVRPPGSIDWRRTRPTCGPRLAGRSMRARSSSRLSLVAKAWRFWQLAGHLAEGGDLTDAALAMPGAEAPTAERLAALAAGGGIAYWRGDVPKTRSASTRSSGTLPYRSATRRRRPMPTTTCSLHGTWARGRTPAEDDAEAVFRLFEELGDERGRARAIWSRATRTMNEGERPRLHPALRGSQRGLRAKRRCLVSRDGRRQPGMGVLRAWPASRGHKVRGPVPGRIPRHARCLDHDASPWHLRPGSPSTPAERRTLPCFSARSKTSARSTASGHRSESCT